MCTAPREPKHQEVEMSEDKYRLAKFILMAVFVFGLLVIGWRVCYFTGEIAWRISDACHLVAENGHYQQFDVQKHLQMGPDGRLIRVIGTFDTRTGHSSI